MKKLILIAALSAAATANAMAAPPVTYEPIEECWTPPEFRKSGEPLPPEEIRGYTIFYQYAGSEALTQIGGEIPSSTTCVTFTPTLATDVCFSGHTIDTDGLISDISNVVCKTPVAIDRRPEPFNWKALINILK